MSTHAQPDAMSLSDFAHHIQRSKSYVSTLKKDGRLVLLDEDRVDVAASLARIAETAGYGRPSGIVSPEVARLREQREFYETEEKRIAWEKECKRLVEAQRVVDAAGKVGTLVRSRLEALSSQLAPQLAHISDETRCRVLIDDHVESLLREIAAALRDLTGGASQAATGDATREHSA